MKTAPANGSPALQHRIGIWVCKVEASSVNACAPLLAAEESHRASRYIRPEDAQRSIVAHGVKRWVLSRATGVGEADLRFECLPAGKPLLAGGPHFSLSHSGDWIALALSRHAAIGVDIEFASTVDHRPIHARVLDADELLQVRRAEDPGHAFLACWTRKEAVLKACGRGLGVALQQVHCAQGSTAWCGQQAFHVLTRPWCGGMLSVACEQPIDACSVIELQVHPEGRRRTLHPGPPLFVQRWTSRARSAP